MSEFKIDKDIPIPDGKRNSIYPWNKMNIGDSFFIKTKSISMGATNKRYSPKRFITRKVEDGYRVWRIS